MIEELFAKHVRRQLTQQEWLVLDQLLREMDKPITSAGKSYAKTKLLPPEENPSGFRFRLNQ